jgi:acyl carrier protein
VNTTVAKAIERDRITAIVLEAVSDANQLRSGDQKIDETADAPLFGGDGPLDSLGLVSLLMDIEEMLVDEGFEISLSSEDAMSQKRSPYRDVASLSDYIEQCIGKCG